MLRDTAVATIARRLGNRTGMESDIIAEMQLAQTTLESDATIRPWFLLTEIASTTATAGEERLQLPSNFLAEYEEGTLFVYDGTLDDPWVELVKCPFDDNVKVAKGASGKPESYSLTGDYFRLFPTPDAAYTMKMLYFKQDTTLSSDVENQWLKYAPQLLIAETGITMAAYLQNKIAHAMFSGLRDLERKRLLVENTSREVTNEELFMGGQ